MRSAGGGRYWWIWIAVVPLAAWALARALGLDGGSLLVPLLAFTPYAAVAALLIAGVATALGNWPAATVAWLATLCLLAAVLPRAIGDRGEDPAGHETLRLLSANVHVGHADPWALVAMVERLHPDLLAIQELQPELVARLREAGIGRLLPHAVLDANPPGTRRPGSGIYSRLPLRQLPGRSAYALAVAMRMPSGRTVRVVDVHPHTPKPGHVGEWRESLEGLPSAGSGPPWVLVGDFNATLDQAELRDVVARGYRDAGDLTGKGLEPTWPQGWNGLPGLITIDHVLADRRLGIASYAVEHQLGSDHRAIDAELFLP